MVALELAHVFDQKVRFDFSSAAAHDASARLTKQHRFHPADPHFWIALACMS
ncbi:MAG: hypothetical protein WB999_17695 [Candidatus Binataceae bacterium]